MTKRGVLLVGHGTRDEVGTAQFFELGQRLAERLGPTPVASSLLEFQEPTIPQGWDSLVKLGVDHVDVAPLLLFAAGHAKEDIPQCAIECQSRTPQVSFDQSRPLSRHRSIVELVMRRLRQTLALVDAAPDRIAVLMVGRGSRDPCATADMRVLSEIVKRRVDVGAVETSFYAMASPSMRETLDRVSASGRFDCVVVHPHLLFDGRLFQAIKQQTEEVSVLFPSMQFMTSEYLGPDRLVADAIAARIGQAK